jgi:hypothetical protein
MSTGLVYRRLVEPAQRISLHFLYGGSVIGKKMFPGTMAICDTPQQHGDGFTHHRLSATMGNGKKHATQRWLWFNVGFGSFGVWHRHPWMREYATAGALMSQLWKYADRLDHPPADANASAHELWCALTLVYQWRGSDGDKRGPLWWLFFGDLLTIGGIEDSLAGHHYSLNICCDLPREEEGRHHESYRLLLKQQAISEDVNEAVPFSTAAEGPWKAAIRSSTKRGSSIEKHHEGEEINRKGLFGDQFNEYDHRKRRKLKKAAKEAEQAPPVIMLVFVQCWQCQESFQTAVATDEYCPECQLDWARSSDLEKKKKKKKKTTATTETTEQKAAKAAKEAEEKATKKKAEDKAAKAAKKKEAKAAKKKEEEEAKEAEKLQQQDVEQTPAETDKKKPAVFEIGDVVQGCWELDAESNAWEFGTIKSILWDSEPPNLGDPQWAYTIQWDDNTKDDLPWHYNGEEWPMHSLRVPPAKQLRKRNRNKPITSDIDHANVYTRC